MDKNIANESLAQVKDMLAGTFAGFIYKLSGYPFDTLKVLAQVDTRRNIPLWKLFVETTHDKGVYRLFRGLSAPLFGSCLETLICFWLFGMGERYLQSYFQKNQLDLYQIGLAGAFSGIGSSFFMTPIEYVKCQMQSHETTIYYRNTQDCIYKTLKYHPIRLYSGLNATMIREMFGSFIYFSSYRASCRLLCYLSGHKYNHNSNNENTPPLWIISTSGSLSGMAYWIVVYPIDLIKSHIQINNLQRQSIFLSLIYRCRKYGFLSLYSGLSVTIPGAIVCNSLIFVGYEYSRNFLDVIW